MGCVTDWSTGDVRLLKAEIARLCGKDASVQLNPGAGQQGKATQLLD